MTKKELLIKKIVAEEMKKDYEEKVLNKKRSKYSYKNLKIWVLKKKYEKK